jgi:hypothetical protein
LPQRFFQSFLLGCDVAAFLDSAVTIFLQKMRQILQDFRIGYQRSTAQVTVALQLNQGE